MQSNIIRQSKLLDLNAFYNDWLLLDVCVAHQECSFRVCDMHFKIDRPL